MLITPGAWERALCLHRVAEGYSGPPVLGRLKDQGEARRRYAPFNAMVVHIQKPGARYVLSSSEWESTYRRVLKPGAQPLLIFQPRGPYMLVYDVGDTEALPGALPLPKAITAPVSVIARVSEKELADVWHHTRMNLAPLGIRLTLVDHGASAPAGARTAAGPAGSSTAPGVGLVTGKRSIRRCSRSR